MKLRLAGVLKDSVVDGPGIRFVVFTQGCPHHCKGCHNQHTWDPTGGYELDIKDILEEVRQSKLTRGVTLSGGEPFLQAEALVELGEGINAQGKDIITYTGYIWEQLLELSLTRPAVKHLISLSSFIIDGPFIESERDISLAFRGSRNQRIINVAQSLAQAKVIKENFD